MLFARGFGDIHTGKKLPHRFFFFIGEGKCQHRKSFRCLPFDRGALITTKKERDSAIFFLVVKKSKGSVSVAVFVIVVGFCFFEFMTVE